MICNNCKIENNNDSNFCKSCGFKLQRVSKCSVCLQDIKLTTLGCGHSACNKCLNIIYTSSKKCPICRKEINKCNICKGFRIINNECIDCKKILNEKLLVCNLCYSDDLNIFTTSDTKIINCNNCKENYIRGIHLPLRDLFFLRIKKKDEISGKFKSICQECYSENLNIDLNNNIIKCNNCKKYNIKILKIDKCRSHLYNVIDKELVNPTIINICSYCNSRDIEYTENEFYKGYDCNNCKNNCIDIKPWIKNKKKSILHRESVNPIIKLICKSCNSDNIYHKNYTTNNIIICNDCGCETEYPDGRAIDI